MGRWAESEFGRDTLPSQAYIFPGMSSREKIEAALGAFGRVRFHRHDVYERFLAGEDGDEACLLFHLYGAPILCDLVSVLQDGGVKEAFFFGNAYGLASGLRIGDRVLPLRTQTLDGISVQLGAGSYTIPNLELSEDVAAALRSAGLSFHTGTSVSVPATFWHGDESRIDPDALALELEFAAFCHCARAAGLRTAGLLVISDTRDHGLLDRGLPHDPEMVAAFRAVKQYRQGQAGP
jgi:hypothetical protein